MMRIALVGPSHPFRGGIAHYTTLLYKNLKKRFDVEFFAFKRQYPKWFFPGKSDHDTSLRPLTEECVHRLLDSVNPITWWQVFKGIQRMNPKLVIFPWWVSFWTPQFWVIATLVKLFTNAKVLFICHNVVEHDAQFYNRICTRLVLSRGDHFIVHSQDDYDNLRVLLPKADIWLRHHPIYDFFSWRDISKEDARKSLGLKGDTILFFGFIRSYKGLKYLIEAMPQILQHRKLNLLIVGEFWEKEASYRHTISQLGLDDYVYIVNEYVPNEEVYRYFSAADCVVLPYVTATQSGIVKIAYDFNKPAIVTNVGGLPDEVENGITGYVVPPKDAKALAEAIINFYELEKEKEFGDNIVQFRNRFSWDYLVQSIAEIANHRVR